MNEEWKDIEGYECIYHINTISYSKQYARRKICKNEKTQNKAYGHSMDFS